MCFFFFSQGVDFAGWRSKREYERRLRLYQQRTNVAKELLETENSYFAGLTIIVKHYMASLLEVTNSNKPWITLQEVEKIFSEIEVKKTSRYKN